MVLRSFQCHKYFKLKWGHDFRAEGGNDDTALNDKSCPSRNCSASPNAKHDSTMDFDLHQCLNSVHDEGQHVHARSDETSPGRQSRSPSSHSGHDLDDNYDEQLDFDENCISGSPSDIIAGVSSDACGLKTEPPSPTLNVPDTEDKEGDEQPPLSSSQHLSPKRTPSQGPKHSPSLDRDQGPAQAGSRSPARKRPVSAVHTRPGNEPGSGIQGREQGATAVKRALVPVPAPALNVPYRRSGGRRQRSPPRGAPLHLTSHDRRLDGPPRFGFGGRDSEHGHPVGPRLTSHRGPATGMPYQYDRYDVYGLCTSTSEGYGASNSYIISATVSGERVLLDAASSNIALQDRIYKDA